MEGVMVPEAALEAERDVRAHIRQLFLDQLQKTAGTNSRHSDGRGERGGGQDQGTGRERGIGVAHLNVCARFNRQFATGSTAREQAYASPRQPHASPHQCLPQSRSTIQCALPYQSTTTANLASSRFAYPPFAVQCAPTVCLSSWSPSEPCCRG